jgi:predicted RNase H-like HicB family nuclease
MRYPIILTPDLEEGGFVAECPAIPGCVSEGDTVEEAIENIREAIEGCLAVLREKGEAPPRAGDPLLATVEVGG